MYSGKEWGKEPVPFRVPVSIDQKDYTPKKLCRTVATTTRNTQLPNQAAATLPVSGSPLFHLLNTFTAPTRPTMAPIAYIRLVPEAK